MIGGADRRAFSTFVRMRLRSPRTLPRRPSRSRNGGTHGDRPVSSMESGTGGRRTHGMRISSIRASSARRFTYCVVRVAKKDQWTVSPPGAVGNVAGIGP